MRAALGVGAGPWVRGGFFIDAARRGGKEKMPMHDASVSWNLCAGAICSAFGRSLHAMASSFHAAESLSWF